MSAGEFERSRYQDGKGNIYACRVQPETLELVLNGVTNTAPTGAVNTPIRARMTGSRRKYGCRARSVRIQFTAAVPEGYKPGQVIEIPILQQSVYDTMTDDPNATGTYLELPVELVGATNESVK